MPTHRVGHTPSVEEALQKLSGADIAASPVDSDFDEVAKQLYAVESPPPSAPETVAPAAPAMSTPSTPNPQPAVPQPAAKAQAENSALIEQLQAVAKPDAASRVDVVTTDELLETIRTSSQNAVRRLAAVSNAAGKSTAPRPAEATSPSSGISDLSREVERAVASAVAAASYHHDVEQRATTMASNIVSDAAAEAERTVQRAESERATMLAGARSEAKQLLSDGKAQRDAIIARAEARAEGIVEQADVELARRVRHIADTTGAIADIADAALGRLAAGSLTGEQLAQFVTALGAATERIISSQSPTKEQ